MGAGEWMTLGLFIFAASIDGWNEWQWRKRHKPK